MGWEPVNGGGYNYDPYDQVEITSRKEQYARSFYAGDRLVAHQVTRDSLEYKNNGQTRDGDPWGVYEEYWYDALGRRVFKRSRQDSPLCTYSERCFSSFERYVWDGDQILWELRSGLSNTQNPIGSGAYTGESGTIGYVHAGRIDAPVGMIRNDSTVALHRGWRGTYATATDASGNEIATDVPWPDGSWKGSGVSIDTRERHTWVGSLPMGQEDDSGLRYRRNRYYDPNSGQFTQQDPIGIAGGLNLYGYADGDPINFSDPFGLSPCDEQYDWEEQTEEWLACKFEETAAREEERGREAAERADFFEKAECTVRVLSSAGAVASDGLLLSGIGGIVKNGIRAVSGPLWRTGQGWRATADVARERATIRSGLVGAGVVADRVGGGSSGVRDAVGRFFTLQSPEELQQTAQVCSL